MSAKNVPQVRQSQEMAKRRVLYWFRTMPPYKTNGKPSVSAISKRTSVSERKVKEILLAEGLIDEKR